MNETVLPLGLGKREPQRREKQDGVPPKRREVTPRRYPHPVTPATPKVGNLPLADDIFLDGNFAYGYVSPQFQDYGAVMNTVGYGLGNPYTVVQSPYEPPVDDIPVLPTLAQVVNQIKTAVFPSSNNVSCECLYGTSYIDESGNCRCNNDTVQTMTNTNTNNTSTNTGNTNTNTGNTNTNTGNTNTNTGNTNTGNTNTGGTTLTIPDNIKPLLIAGVVGVGLLLLLK